VSVALAVAVTPTPSSPEQALRLRPRAAERRVLEIVTSFMVIGALVCGSLTAP
jgi:hypothetical protein